MSNLIERKGSEVELIKINPNNRPYYSDDFIKGFECGAKRQFEADKKDRPKGEWAEREVLEDTVINEWQSARCSECGKYHTTPYMYYFDNFNFCPNCGADMREREDE